MHETENTYRYRLLKLTKKYDYRIQKIKMELII